MGIWSLFNNSPKETNASKDRWLEEKARSMLERDPVEGSILVPKLALVKGHISADAVRKLVTLMPPMLRGAIGSAIIDYRRDN